MTEASSAVTPYPSYPSSITMACPVFLAEAISASRSRGSVVRGSTTSAETPSASRRSAASRATYTMLVVATIVTPDPSRLTSATPRGITKSSPGGTGPLVWYIILSSNTTTGLSSRMAALSRPFASAGVAGRATFSPGTWLTQAWRLWLCCAADRRGAPLGDVLADDEHPLVGPHLLGQGLVHGLGECQLAFGSGGFLGPDLATRRRPGPPPQRPGRARPARTPRRRTPPPRPPAPGARAPRDPRHPAPGSSRPSAARGRGWPSSPPPPPSTGSTPGPRRRRGVRTTGRSCTRGRRDRRRREPVRLPCGLRRSLRGRPGRRRPRRGCRTPRPER